MRKFNVNAWFSHAKDEFKKGLLRKVRNVTIRDVHLEIKVSGSTLSGYKILDTNTQFDFAENINFRGKYTVSIQSFINICTFAVWKITREATTQYIYPRA